MPGASPDHQPEAQRQRAQGRAVAGLLTVGEESKIAIGFFIGAGVMLAGAIAGGLFAVSAEQKPVEPEEPEGGAE